VITDLQPGGETTILSWMLPALRERGIDGNVLALAPDVDDPKVTDTEPMRRLRESGIDVTTGHLRRPGDLPAVTRMLLSDLRRRKPDVVHTYLFHAGVLARPVARVATQAALVSSVVNVGGWKTRAAARLDLMSLRLADRVVVNAHAVAHRISSGSRALANSIEVQYGGVDLAAANGASGDGLPTRGRPVIGVVGRLRPAKGPDIALRAIAELRHQGDDASLVFLGQGKLRPELDALSRELGLDASTTFVDPVPHHRVFEFLKSIDVLMVPSRWEGIPAVILEAMACGTPVVATAVGGVPELIRDEENALLAPADPRALSERLRHVLHDQRLRDRLIQHGLATARGFPAEAAVAERSRLYEELGAG
jgi:glycosyltransferase involved in cell wall biosynthesis